MLLVPPVLLINIILLSVQPNSLSVQSGGSPTWNTNVPSPLDGFKEENEIKQTIIAMKQVTPQDVRRLVRKVEWVAGNTFEMYRHDYNVYNTTPVSASTSLYESNYYVINEDLRVYICLQNGTDPENPKGRPSYDQPTFVDLEPSLELVEMDIFGNIFIPLNHQK